MMPVRFESLFAPAHMMASHVLPQSCSPSDIAQYIRILELDTCGELVESMRAAYAIPAACERPEPSGPDVVSRPGKRMRSGCPCKREPNLRSVRHSSMGK